MRIKMLRNLAIKPGRPESEQRYEGQEYDVSNKEGAGLIARHLAVDLGKPAPPPDEDEGEGDDGLDGMKLSELKAVAAAEGITLTAKNKADAVAEIRAARQAAGGRGDGPGDGAESGDAGE